MKHLPPSAIDTAAKHIKDILSQAIQYAATEKALIVMDTQSPLAVALTEGYRRCLPAATVLDFYALEPTEITAALAALNASDLVVLIQSTSFRLNAFRLRVELFERSLKVIEHPHLLRMTDAEAIYYIDSLEYDSNYYHGVGHALKKRIDVAQQGVIESHEARLTFAGPFEPAKLNIGDYSNMKNIGGQFPIGEVFTEAQNLESVNGRIRIFAFADTTFQVNRVEQPITLIVSAGRVTDVIDSTSEFDTVLANIRADEGEVWLRELGFGMNRAFTRERTVCDIGTYERMCGIHLSLGSKHTVYKKPNFRQRDTWHHVDVFVDTSAVYLDDVNIFKENTWQV